MSSKQFIKGFIKLYRANECLWKLTSPEYTNKNIKKSAYKELVEFCRKYYDEADNEFARRKIQNLRAAFRKELKKVQDSKKNGTDTDNIYCPQLWYYDLLLFTVDDGKFSQENFDSGANIKSEEESSVEDSFGEDANTQTWKKIKMDESTCASPTSVVSQPENAQNSKVTLVSCDLLDLSFQQAQELRRLNHIR